MKGKWVVLLSVMGILMGGLFWKLRPHSITVFAMRLPSGHVFLAEDPDHPQLRAFKRREGIAAIVKGKRSEGEALLALAKWTSNLFPVTSPFPNYPPWNAKVILARIRTGQTGGFCAQYALIFGQGSQSLGFPVRYVDLAGPEGGAGHFISEVYLSSRGKWVAFDAQYGIAYADREGNLLSALDLHEFAVSLAQGEVLQLPEGVPASREQLALYYNLRYYLRNNFLTQPVYVSYRDRSGGTQMLFESYRMRWVDTFTKDISESNPSIGVSSNREDYDFDFDWNHFVRKTLYSVEELQAVLYEGEAMILYKLRMPHKVLQHFITSKIPADYNYEPFLN